MTKPRPAEFKWRQFEPQLILMAVGWYRRFSLSYRDVEELLQERGMSADHVIVWRWGQRYAPEVDRLLRPHLKPTNKSWRVDENYIRVKGKWTYLYRAVDSAGASIDFLHSAQRDAATAKRFFQKALCSPNHPTPRVINVDKNPSYPPVVEALKSEGTLWRRWTAARCNTLITSWSKIIGPSSGACERAKASAGSGEPTARSKVTKRCMRFGRGKPGGWASVRLSANSISSLGCSRLQSDATPASCLPCFAA